MGVSLGKKQFHSPNETPYLQNEIVFLRIETPFCEIFCIFAVSIKNTVLTLSFAFSKITEKSWQTRGWASQLSLFLVSIVAEDAEQIEEEVDEVEIQRQGSEEGKLLSALAHVILSLEHLFNLLAIPGSQTDEDSHTDIAQDVIETRALQEHVYHGSDNQSDQSHEEYLAH